MSTEFSETGLKITANTDHFYPSQTILGFTLVALETAIGTDIDIATSSFKLFDERDRGKVKNMHDGVLLAQAQAAARIIEIGVLRGTDEISDTARNISNREAALYQLPYTLTSVVEGLGKIWVDINGENPQPKEVPHAQTDVELMRASGMYVSGMGLPDTTSHNPNF